MKCLFCGNKLVDTASTCDPATKNCEFSFYKQHVLLRYYICVNKKIGIVDHGWIDAIKKEFFIKGILISYESFYHKEFEFDYSSFLKEGFVF